jgi:hypothetical protein
MDETDFAFGDGGFGTGMGAADPYNAAGSFGA